MLPWGLFSRPLDVLCCAVLCCVVLCCTMLCCRYELCNVRKPAVIRLLLLSLASDGALQ